MSLLGYRNRIATMVDLSANYIFSRQPQRDSGRTDDTVRQAREQIPPGYPARPTSIFVGARRTSEMPSVSMTRPRHEHSLRLWRRSCELLPRTSRRPDPDPATTHFEVVFN